MLIRRLLFLIASDARLRLVHRDHSGRFETVWRATPLSGGQEQNVSEVARQARRWIADDHLEGLVVVAPAHELDAIVPKLEHDLVVVGKVEADLYMKLDRDLAAALDPALHAPLPER